MKYCRYCGKTIDNDSNFCTHCGRNQEVQDTGTIPGLISKLFSRFLEMISGFANRAYSNISIAKNKSKSHVSNIIKRWVKRVLIIFLTLIVVGLLVLLGFWLYGIYKTSKWEKDDERREAIALKDISKADKIARELFEEYANDSHRYDFDGSKCGFDHIERGIEIIRNAAEKGDAHAQFTLGCIYAGARYDSKYEKWKWGNYTIMNTDINHERAAYWYNQSAIQGNPSAMGNLANSYRYGKGVEKNLIKATELMKSAAEKGNAYAQLNFGDMYRDGEVWIKVESDSVGGGYLIIHAKPNIEKAKEWWKKSLENGDSLAKERLERIYE